MIGGECGQMFLGVSDGVHHFISAQQFHKLLHTQMKLQRKLLSRTRGDQHRKKKKREAAEKGSERAYFEASEFGSVFAAPTQRSTHFALRQTLQNASRRHKHVQIHQILTRVAQHTITCRSMECGHICVDVREKRLSPVFLSLMQAAVQY